MKKSWLVAILFITASIFALDDFSVPHTWSPGDTIRDSDFEANNDTIEAWAARTNDSIGAKFLRTSAMGDSQWVKIKVDTLIADSIKARVLAITTYSPDSLYGRTARLSGDMFADSIYARVLKMSAGLQVGGTAKLDSVNMDGGAIGIDNGGTAFTLHAYDLRRGYLQGKITDGGTVDTIAIKRPGSLIEADILNCRQLTSDSLPTSIIMMDAAEDTLRVSSGGKVWKFLPVANQ